MRRAVIPLIGGALVVGAAAATLVLLRDRQAAEETRVRPRGRLVPEESPLRLTDIARDAGITRITRCGTAVKYYILDTTGSGAAFFDYDGDGHEDLFVASAGSYEPPSGRARELPSPGDALYRNQGDGTFEEVTEPAGVAFNGWSQGCAVGDHDNDGDPDLYLSVFGTNRFYRNNGDGTFTECAREAGVDHPAWGTSTVFLDHDLDGDLDLYLVNYLDFDLQDPPNGGEPCLQDGIPISCAPVLNRPAPDVLYRNDGDGGFTDVSAEAGVDLRDGAYGLGVVAGDHDGDGDPDVYVVNDTSANFLLRNDGDGTFREVGLEAGVSLNETGQAQSGMGADMADVDGDGRLDIFAANYAGELNAFYRNIGDAGFIDATVESGLGARSFPHMGWAAKFFDLENDGDLDLLVANGHLQVRIDETSLGFTYLQPSLLYQNDGRGRFREIRSDLGEDFSRPRSCRAGAFADLDNDGDLDVALTVMDAPPVLLRNDGGNRMSFIALLLEGRRSNRDGIGARVEVRAGGKRQVRWVSRGGSYLASSTPRVYVGLGECARADEVTVRWPSGAVDELGSLEPRFLYGVREEHRVVWKRPL